jgi:succinoglycan biosynthesis protein ExoA
MIDPQPGRVAADSPIIPAVSVLTPVYNEEAMLPEILERFQSQEDPHGTIEFLFADGRSSDRTRELLERAAESDPRIHVYDNPKRLTSSGLNIGLAHARGDYIARMDAHALYPVDYLRTAVDRLARGDVAAVSGPQIAVGHDRWSRRVAAALGTRLGVGGSNFRSAIETETETDSGFTGVWHRETILRHKGWDELAYPNEDSELAARIREEGGRLVMLPELAAQYAPRNSLAGLATQYWRYGRARARTARRHPISRRTSHLLPPALVLALVAALLPTRRLSTAARSALVAYLAALVDAAARAGCPGEDAIFVPVVLVVMHLSWGSGYLLGTVRPTPAVKPLQDR